MRPVAEKLGLQSARIAFAGSVLQKCAPVRSAAQTQPSERSVTELESENRRYYQTELPQGGHIACFAYVGEEIVGCGGICLYHEMPSPDNLNGKCAYLMNIYTRPQFRGHGIGNRIVRWLVEQARQRHISKIYLETSDKGRPLYQTIGFADMKDMMKLSREK